MKHYIYILIASLFSFIQVQAQSTDDTHVEVKAGQELLENLLTDGQKQHITHLTVKGTLQEADYAYLRNTLFKQLEELNLRDADIDTIPKRGFQGQTNANIILPKRLKYLSDNSLNITNIKTATVTLTGKFPHLGCNVYSEEISDNRETNRLKIIPSIDNTYCKLEGDQVYSFNGDTLFYSPSIFLSLKVKEGTKVIYNNCFENLYLASFQKLTFPSTVIYIGNRALYNVRIAFAAKLKSIQYNNTECLFEVRSKIPPKMGNSVFCLSNNINTSNSFVLFTLLRVPLESIELYKKEQGWNYFAHIEGVDFNRINSISKEVGLRIKITNDKIILLSEKKLSNFKLFNINGQQIFQEPIYSKKVEMFKPTVHPSIGIITYEDGEKTTIKIQ